MPYRGSMRIVNRRLLAGCATALVATLALAGCVPTPTPTPSTSAATDAPVFASDEEALAAATEAYAAYLKVSDAVGSEGGSNPERYDGVASGPALANASKSAGQFRDMGAHSVGVTSFEVADLQSWGYDRERGTFVTLYLCDDVSQVDVFDSNGASIVSPDRPDRTPFEVSLTALVDSELQLASKDAWKGGNFC